MKMEYPCAPLSWLCPSAASSTCWGPSCYCQEPTYPTISRKTTLMGGSPTGSVKDFDRGRGLLESTLPCCADWAADGRMLTASTSWRRGPTVSLPLTKRRTGRRAICQLPTTGRRSRKQTKVPTLTGAVDVITGLSFTSQLIISLYLTMKITMRPLKDEFANARQEHIKKLLHFWDSVLLTCKGE